MPRPRKNFKLRPPKFLGLHPLKFQNTGTYTGHYKGPPISERRLRYARRCAIAREPLHLPFIHNILGSSMRKSVPIEQATRNHPNCVYLFRNVRTGQVLYSNTAYIKPEDALPQLIFYGKKTVPEKYRKDDWRPYVAVQFRSKHEAFLALKLFRELRMLRDYAWRNPGAHAPNKRERKRRTMDQTGTSACDISTVIGKMNEELEQGELNRLTQWKMVEDFAMNARTGGLAILNKQIRRVHKMFTRKRMSKKVRRWGREAIEKSLQKWYKNRMMMNRAMVAVKQFRVAVANTEKGVKLLSTTETPVQNSHLETKHGQLPDEPNSSGATLTTAAEDTRNSEASMVTLSGDQTLESVTLLQNASELPNRKTSEVPANETSVELPLKNSEQLSVDVDPTLSSMPTPVENSLGASSKTDRRPEKPGPMENPELTGKYGLKLDTPLATLTKWMIARRIGSGQQALTVDGTRQPAIFEADQSIDQDEENDAPEESAINVFWSEIRDRQFTDGWPTNTVHFSTGNRMGADQYAFDLPETYITDTEQYEWPVFSGDEGEEPYVPMSRSARLKAGMPVEKEIAWQPRTKKEIKKHRKGRTGLAFQEWKVKMGYAEDPEIIKETKDVEQKPSDEEEDDELKSMLEEAAKATEAAEAAKWRNMEAQKKAQKDKVREHYEHFFAQLVQRRRSKPAQASKSTLASLVKKHRHEARA